MTAPQTPFRYPRRTRILIVVVLAVATAGFTLGFLAYEADDGDGATAAELVTGMGEGGEGRVVNPELRVNPRRDAEAIPAQDTILLQLEPGWTAELELRQAGRAPVPLPADELDVTPLNQYVFVPGDGKVIERLPAGRTCVRYTAWSRIEGRAASERTDEWCFSVV